MKKAIKQLRLAGFILLILLAVFGVSIAGGIPVVPKRKEQAEEIKKELAEEASSMERKQ